MYVGEARYQGHHSEVYPLRSGFIESVEGYEQRQGPDLEKNGSDHPTVYEFAQIRGEQKHQETDNIRR